MFNNVDAFPDIAFTFPPVTVRMHRFFLRARLPDLGNATPFMALLPFCSGLAQQLMQIH